MEQEGHRDSSHSFAEKKRIVEKYIAVASRYIDLDITRVANENSNQCICCSSELKDTESAKMGMVMCPSCNTYNMGLHAHKVSFVTRFT